MIQKKEFHPDPNIPYLAAKELFRQIQNLTACLKEMVSSYPELKDVIPEFDIAEGHFNDAIDELEAALEAKD